MAKSLIRAVTINGSDYEDDDFTVLLGSGYNIRMNLGDGNDRAVTGDGNDTIKGGAGDDFIDGGKGNNDIDGGSERDTIYTGSGNDNIKGGTGDDFIFSGTGVDTISLGAGNDVGIMAGSGIMKGGTGNDTMIEYSGSLDSGPTFLYGESGRDDMHGYSGHATLFAGDGNDLLELAGGDVGVGGAGSDTFSFNRFSSGDGLHVTISDFAPKTSHEKNGAGDTLNFSDWATYTYTHDDVAHTTTIHGDPLNNSSLLRVVGNDLQIDFEGQTFDVHGVGDAITHAGGVSAAVNEGIILLGGPSWEAAFADPTDIKG